MDTSGQTISRYAWCQDGELAVVDGNDNDSGEDYLRNFR